MGLRDLTRRIALQVPILKRVHRELNVLRDQREVLCADNEKLAANNAQLAANNAQLAGRVSARTADNEKLAAQVAELASALSLRESELRRLRANDSMTAAPNGQKAVTVTLNGVAAAQLSRYFLAPLVDLGRANPKYAGVLCPESELNRPKIGVTESLLSGAEEYFSKFQSFSYIFGLLKGELDALGLEPRGVAVDFGSGFGNTVIPLLENFSDLSIVATDISPDLLAILLREAEKRGVRDRCVAVALDAQRDYFAEGFADVVFGGAVLHHLAEPQTLLQTVIRILKPGGHAIFFEPFENGHSVLRLAYEEIVRRAKVGGESGSGFDFLQALINDIAARSHRRNYPGFSEAWFNLDDKWLFTHSYFERMRHLIGASDIRIRSFNKPSHPFTAQTRSALVNYGGLTVPDCLPSWAWDVLRRYDEDAFSSDMKSDLVIEGAVVITK